MLSGDAVDDKTGYFLLSARAQRTKRNRTVWNRKTD